MSAHISPISPLHLPYISQAPASEMSGVEAVIHHVTLEAARLEALAEQILEEGGPEDERLQAINAPT